MAVTELLLQVDAIQKTVTYKNVTKNITDTYWTSDIVPVLYPLWDSDKDKLVLFGWYANDTYIYNAVTNRLHRFEYSLQEETKYPGAKLGKQDEIFVKSEYADATSRIFWRTTDHGVLGNDGVIKSSGRDDGDIGKSFSRYNLMFTQALNILIPCNTDLKVGDIIRCSLPDLKMGKATKTDGEKSGLYLIKELRHHFEPNQMTTSLKLVRDSYGFK